jgi:DNA polymerase III alpha subunit
VIKQNHTDEAGVKALRGAFVNGAMKTSGLTQQEAEDLYHTVLSYTFNKGHATPYATLSYWLMWMKQHHPYEFYLATLRLEGSQYNREKYEIDAFKNGVPVLIPHVNGAAHYEFVRFQGERIIRAGLASIKGVGDVAANAIEKEWRKNGDYKSEEDLVERVNGFDMVWKGRKPNKYEVKVIRGTPVNSKVLEALREAGALEFNPTTYKQLCVKYYNRVIAEHKQMQRKWFKKAKEA